MKRLNQCAWLLAVMAASVVGQAQPPANPLAKPAVEAKPAEGAQPAKVDESRPVVTLIDAGAEPRQVLRLRPAVGQSQATKLRMKMEMQMKVGEQELPSPELPAMIMTFNMKTKAVSAEGDIAYDLAFTECGVDEKAEAPAQVIDMMKEAMAPMAKITGTGVVTSRGFNKDVQFKLPGDLDPTAMGIMDGMKQQMGQMGSPLPEEAVGAGAKWKVETKVKSQGMNIDQVATVELIGIKDGVANMKVTIGQTAPANQAIKAPGVPEGVNVEVVSLRSAGSGQLTQGLTFMAPSTADTKIVTDMSMKVTQGADVQMMTQKITIDVKMTGSEVGAKPAETPVKPDEAK